VRWNVTESPRPDTHGRTKSQPLHKTEAVFDQSIKFKQRIGIRSQSRLLRNCPMKFEVVWEPMDSRPVTIGTLVVDLAQFARERHHFFPSLLRTDTFHRDKSPGPDMVEPTEESGAYDRRLLYMLHGTRTNSLIGLRIKVDYLHGGEDFKVPPFDAPAINYGDNNVTAELNGENEQVEDIAGQRATANKNSRDKLRRLRSSVFEDLRRNDNHKMDLNVEWLDMDNFLMGKKIRAIPKEAFAELHARGIFERYDIEKHQPGTPYAETEIQEQFVSWNVL